MKLSYLQQGFGSGLPLVLLHPYPMNAKFWCNQLASLSKTRHVIAPNFRGYGATRVEPQDEFSMERFATDIRKTLATAQIPKAIFGGCSWGGYVLFELWRQQPDLIGGLILCDTRAEADTEQARARRLEQVDHVRKAGTAELPDTAVGFLSENVRLNNHAVVNDVRAWAQEPNCDTIIKSLEMLAARPDSTPTLATITVPTLVMVGAEDQVTPLDCAQRLADGIADSSLVIVPDAGHYAPLENPAVVNEAILDFLATPAIA